MTSKDRERVFALRSWGNEILHSGGFKSNGQPLGEKIPQEQREFERSLIPSPVGGQPGYRLNGRHK